MGKRIVYKKQDGTGIAVVIPADPEADIAAVAEASVPVGVPYAVVDESAIPSDRTFRDAWVHEGEKVGVDMPRAREIHKERLRSIRAPILESLDVQFMRAVETGDDAKKADVAAKKQALRDVTAHPGIESAQTPDDLKAVIPEALLEVP